MAIKRALFIALFILTIAVGIFVIDRVYMKYEKFPFETTVIILQREQSTTFRYSDTPGLFYEMIPNLVAKDSYCVTNSMGIRSKEYEIPKPPNTFRIMVLGDSVSYGTGLKQQEAFPALLEEKLNSGQPKIKYEVINCSILGYNTIQEYIAFITKWYRYNPDLVIIFFCNNDMSPAFIEWEDARGPIYNYLSRLSMKDRFSINMTPHEVMSVSMPNLLHTPLFMHRRLILHSSLYRTLLIKLYDFLSTHNEYKYPPQGYLNAIKNQAEYAIIHLNMYCKKITSV